MVASILDGSRKQNFWEADACSLAKHSTTCGFSLSKDSGCGKHVNVLKFLQPSVDFTQFFFILYPKRQNPMPMTYSDQSLTMLAQPLHSVTKTALMILCLS